MDQYRKANRLKNYNYSSQGYYFVTICVKNRENIFGKIKDEKLVLNNLGKIVENFWKEIPKHYENVKIDEFIIMPDHIHGIIVIKYGGEDFVSSNDVVGVAYMRPLQRYDRSKMLLSKVIQSFKAAVYRQLNYEKIQKFQWQRSFYDHIIRNDNSLFKIRNYIKYNYLKDHPKKENDQTFINTL